MSGPIKPSADLPNCVDTLGCTPEAASRWWWEEIGAPLPRRRKQIVLIGSRRCDKYRGLFEERLSGNGGMMIIVGGDSVEAVQQRLGLEGSQTIGNWNGRRSRVLQRALPKDMERIVVTVDRISHALARKVLTESGRRGIPLVFRGRRWVTRSAYGAGSSSMSYSSALRKKESST